MTKTMMMIESYCSIISMEFLFFHSSHSFSVYHYFAKVSIWFIILCKHPLLLLPLQQLLFPLAHSHFDQKCWPNEYAKTY